MANPAPERILVTGGTGFIGRYVVDLLTRAGVRPLVTTRTGKSVGDKGAGGGSIDLVKLDLTDSAKTIELVRSYMPETVIHLAGVTGHDDPTGEICHAVNFTGTLNLLKALDTSGVRRVVLLGSAAEYGALPIPFHEDMPARPVSHYGISKARATEAAIKMHTDNGFPVTVLRVFSAFGYGQPPRMFLSQLVTHGLLNRHFKMSDGLQKRDYVHAHDVAVAIMASLTAENAVGRIINIASGRGTVLIELARTVWDLCDADSRLLNIGAMAKTGDDGLDTEADISLAKRILAWRPASSILPADGKTFALPELIRRMSTDLVGNSQMQKPARSKGVLGEDCL